MFPDPVVLPDFWAAFSHAHSHDVVTGYWRSAAHNDRAPDYIGGFFSAKDARVEVLAEGARVYQADIPAGSVVRAQLVLLVHPGALEVRATDSVHVLCCVLPRSLRAEVLPAAQRRLSARRIGGVPSLPFTELLGRWECLSSAA